MRRKHNWVLAVMFLFFLFPIFNSSASAESTVFLSKIATVQDGAITIDGYPSDWEGLEPRVSPMVSDPVGDTSCGEGTDIKYFYLAKDSTHLYWRVDTADGTFSFGTPADRRILVLLFYELNSARGLTVNISSPASGYVSARYDNNQDWTGLYGGSDYGTVKIVAEGKISLVEFAPFDIRSINAYYWKSSSGPQCDEATRTFPTLSGTIYDAETRTSYLANVGLELLPTNGQGGLGFCSDKDGNFQLSNIADGNYILSAGGWSCVNDPSAAVYLRTLYSIDSSGNFLGTDDPGQAKVFSVASETAAISGINFYLAEGATITGTVTGTNGPLENVYVHVGNSNQGYGGCTNIDGVYTIRGITPGTEYRVSAGGSSCNNGPVYARVYYVSENSTTPYWYEGQQLTMGAGQPPPNINFSGLVLAATISGRLTATNQDGSITGLANVPVSVNGPGWGAGTCTNAEGYYTIKGITPGADYRISAGGYGCGNEPIYAQVYYKEGGSTTLYYNSADTFTLTSTETGTFNFSNPALAGIITGKVTNSTGGIANINVHVGSCDTHCVWVASNGTDSNGDYTVFAPEGNWIILFSPGPDGGNYLQQWYNNKSNYIDAEAVTVRAGQTTSGINVRLIAGVKISGKVTNSSGAGIANVDVWAEDQNRNWAGGAGTDELGNYAFFVAPGTYTFGFNPDRANQAGGYYLWQWYPDRPDQNTRTYAIVSGDTTINARLTTGGAVSGTVTGINGIPVYVNVGNSNQGYGGCTNSSGVYTIRGITPGTDYKVSVGGQNWCSENGPHYVQTYYENKPDWNSATLVIVVAEQTTSNINFSGLVPAATVTGIVTGTNGTLLANVPVSVNGPGWGYGACTNSDGVYTIRGITPGIDFKISAGGSSCNNAPMVYAQAYYVENGPTTPNWNGATPLKFDPGETKSGINFSGLMPAATITGMVTDATGSPLANVPVNINGPGWGAGACTNSDGVYTIMGIAPDSGYRISAGGSRCLITPPSTYGTRYAQVYYIGENSTTPDPNMAATFTLAAGESLIDKNFSGLVLPGTVTGTVTDASGAPLANVRVNANGPGWGFGACTNSDGVYTIRGITPGIDFKISAGGSSCNNAPVYAQTYYAINGSTTPYWNDALPFNFAEGETKSGINFSGLVQVAAISGTLQGDPGIGVQNLNVVLHDSQGRLVNYNTIWQNGGFFFGNLVPGSYTIKVYDPLLNYQYAEQNVQASLGSVSNTDITLTRLTPGGANPPSFKNPPNVFVFRTSDTQEYVNLVAEIVDPSGPQPPSIKSVTVVDPAGNLHYLYHERYQAMVDRGTPYAEFWQNSRDNALSNFTTLVGDYTFTILDMDGNRVSQTVNLGSYAPYKLSIPTLSSPINAATVDTNTPTLNWASVAGAERYQVRIYEMGERIFRENVTSTSFEIPPGILSSGRWYSWQVVAMDNTDLNAVDYRSNSPSTNFYTTGGPTPSTQPLAVKIVPWVSGSPLIPHDAYADHQIRVKAVAKGGAPPYNYTWDFGDSTPPYVGTGSFRLGATHVYNAPSDQLFNARITVTDSTNNSVSAIYPVKFSANPSRGVRVNVAIDEALWWLHRQLIRFTSDGKDYAYLPGGNSAGTTAMALQAFVLNGHKPDGDASNPYTESARRAKNYILSQLFPIDIAEETIAGTASTRNPDSNGNGKGLYVKNGHRLYETGLVLMALSTLKDPTLAETIQDLVDYLAYAQVEPDMGGGRGGWRYDTNYRESDMSVTQFPLLGLEAAEHHMGSMGVTIPPYVKEELKNNFLYFVQNKEQGGSNIGGFGYSWPNSWVNVAKTGAGLVGLALTGVPFTDPRVTSALQFIDQHWLQATNDPAYNIGDLYAMYAVMKGMKSYEIRGADTTYIGGHDWYNEYAGWEIDNQKTDGSWQSPFNSYGPQVDTAFGVLLLLPQVFDIGPTAVAQASATQVETYQPVTFSHSGSFHRDNSKTIVLYSWDFNGDGIADWTTTSLTETKTYSLTVPGTYTATLKITDNTGLIGTDQVTIAVTEAPFFPVTIKIEPETFNLGDKGVFTASITLPENGSYGLSNIDATSLRCEGASVVNANVAAKKLVAKFNIQDLKGVLPGDRVTLTVTGNFKDGRPLKGSDTVRVLGKK